MVLTAVVRARCGSADKNTTKQLNVTKARDILLAVVVEVEQVKFSEQHHL